MSDIKSELDNIKKYLVDHVQMSVSTAGEFPWIFTAYYAIDSNLTIYFLTSPSTIHGKQLVNNSKVAVAIADSPQNPVGKKAGLQLSGICTQLTEESEVRVGLDLWRAKLHVESPDYTYEGMQTGKISGRMYKIVPKKIKFFNEALQEEGKEKLIEL
ncbi:MAG: hypothetical protein ACD_40C00209G0002 [uncultured bacterium]|nr:MAG: hypothetical protein ACD_40C00209G0002 [uncultured bacterium]